jgi:hypothetical protein
MKNAEYINRKVVAICSKEYKKGNLYKSFALTLLYRKPYAAGIFAIACKEPSTSSANLKPRLADLLLYYSSPFCISSKAVGVILIE